MSKIKVCTEGRLILEFTFDDLMRIKSWHMAVRQHRELVPKAIVSMSQDPTALEQLTKNITRQGITNSTLNYLRVSNLNTIVTMSMTSKESSIIKVFIISFFFAVMRHIGTNAGIDVEA